MTNQPADELQKKLQQDIRDMFKLEAQRNDINFALSGVERGEMTLQDYEDDLSLAISNYVVQDILPARGKRLAIEVQETLFQKIIPDEGVLEDTKGTFADGYAKAIEDVCDNYYAITQPQAELAPDTGILDHGEGLETWENP